MTTLSLLTAGVTASDADLLLSVEQGRLVLSEGRMAYHEGADASRGQFTRRIRDLRDEPASEAELKEVLAKVWRWQRLARLKNDAGAGAGWGTIELRVVPVEVDADGKPTADQPLADGTTPQLAVGTCFQIEVRGRALQLKYLTVLDLSPDKSITPLFPLEGAGDNVAPLATGQPFRLPGCWRVAPPLGPELLKAIATKYPCNLVVLAQAATRGVPPDVTKGAGGPLGDLLAGLFGDSRGPVAVPGSAGDWGGGDCPYTIVAK
jgi:hypothetical protein